MSDPTGLEAQLAAAQQLYLDNAGWFAAGDVTMAGNFVTACTQLEVLMLEAMTQGGRMQVRQGVNLDKIEIQRSRAEQFISASRGGGVRAVSFKNFRWP